MCLSIFTLPSSSLQRIDTSSGYLKKEYGDPFRQISNEAPRQTFFEINRGFKVLKNITEHVNFVYT